MIMRRMYQLEWKKEAEAIFAEYGPDISDQELRLRVAARRLDRELMIAAFNWDPEIKGY